MVNEVKKDVATKNDQKREKRDDLDPLVIERVITILSFSEGRDKTCKATQYIIKLAIFINAYRFEKRFGVLAKKLSEARQVLRLFRFLNVFKNINSALNQKNQVIGYASLVCSSIGATGELLDDICWLSRNKTLPSWICDYDHWPDYLWLFEILCDIPINSYELIKAYEKYDAVRNSKTGNDPVEIQNSMVKIKSMWLTQIKLVADLFHASRLTFNFPTSSKGQDAICGLLSAGISLYKLWKPKTLQGHRGKSLSDLFDRNKSQKRLLYKRRKSTGNVLNCSEKAAENQDIRN